jgi:hypothetical protein
MKFNPKRLHRLVGLILLLPMLGWAVTGAVFLFKPGYEGAYEQLQIKHYPLAETLAIQPLPGWQKLTVVQTILGSHLLVSVEGEPLHLNMHTLKPVLQPSPGEIQQLIDDAISHSRQRYGEVIEIDNLMVHTSTGVEITLDWQRLALRQSGEDTRLINTLYKIHYLQWSSLAELNKVLGIVGLLLLVTLTLLGIKLSFKRGVT